MHVSQLPSTIYETAEEYWTSPAGVLRRISMIGEAFSYKIVNEAVKIYGETSGVRWMTWVTMADERVCPVCGPRHMRRYHVTWFTPRMPAHANCRCQWELEYDPEKTQFSRKETELRYNLDVKTLPEGQLKSTYDYYSKGYSLKVRTAEATTVGNTKVLIINKPTRKLVRSFLNVIRKLPSEDVEGTDVIQLINKAPYSKRRKVWARGGFEWRVKKTNGYRVQFRDGRSIITVYGKGEDPEGVLAHEVGHNVFKKRILVNHDKFTKWVKYWDDIKADERLHYLMPNDYSLTTPEEGFAECYSWMKTMPGKLSMGTKLFMEKEFDVHEE